MEPDSVVTIVNSSLLVHVVFYVTVGPGKLGQNFKDLIDNFIVIQFVQKSWEQPCFKILISKNSFRLLTGNLSLMYGNSEENIQIEDTPEYLKTKMLVRPHI